jgi:hypothetical protein
MATMPRRGRVSLARGFNPGKSAPPKQAPEGRCNQNSACRLEKAANVIDEYMISSTEHIGPNEMEGTEGDSVQKQDDNNDGHKFDSSYLFGRKIAGYDVGAVDVIKIGHIGPFFFDELDEFPTP